MSTTLIEIRRAKTSDASDVADTHDEAWRTAYQGIIPGNELDKLITRRGPDWWDSAIRKGSRITILQFGDRIAGYANYGRNRARSLFYDGEVYELYLRPEFQGLGFGRRLFNAARKIHPVRRIEIAKSEIINAPTIEADETPIIKRAEPAAEPAEAGEGAAPAAEAVAGDKVEDLAAGDEEE